MIQATDGSFHGSYIDRYGDLIHWWKDATGYHLANVNAQAPEAAQDANGYKAGPAAGPFEVSQAANP